MKIAHNPDALASPTGHPDTPFYSWVVRKGNLVFLSGMNPYDREKRLVGDDIATQARQNFENLRSGIESVDGTLADICAITIFVAASDLQRDVYPVLNPVCYEFFPADPPARVVVGGVAMPRDEILVEILGTGVLG